MADNDDLVLEILKDIQSRMSGLEAGLNELREETRAGFTTLNLTVAGMNKMILGNADQIDALRGAVRNCVERIEKLEDTQATR